MVPHTIFFSILRVRPVMRVQRVAARGGAVQRVVARGGGGAVQRVVARGGGGGSAIQIRDKSINGITVFQYCSALLLFYFRATNLKHIKFPHFHISTFAAFNFPHFHIYNL